MTSVEESGKSRICILKCENVGMLEEDFIDIHWLTSMLIRDYRLTEEKTMGGKLFAWVVFVETFAGVVEFNSSNENDVEIPA